MNTDSQPETPRDLPEADALEQQTPILPEGSEEFTVKDPLPDDAPEADVIEQHTDVLPGSTGYAGIAGAAAGQEASEADLMEQAMAPSLDDEEDYPDAREERL
ncbi:hypothetical protein FBY31_0510 [Arthrobacter sp. SLBN-100]|uniref:hypothetical protein n=1 Tax=Arthrobacter sp. SLBN-100 TaxID=2768450 RepID=UPI00116E103A|nr:hypothetical protein [Arthrobacter sp. SLBN-100]TQJ66500.1 hypothetical protein FBY31_0510 [Arthrobacter sp. SLBN-100]